MDEIITKYGINWKCKKAKTNNLYLIHDEDSYNTCKIWFMLVRHNNKSEYLAYHDTSKIKKQIATHIRTTTYSKHKKLYEISDIKLNTSQNIPKKSKNDYDTIFTGKDLYAIPDRYIDVIEKIDPNLKKYVSKILNLDSPKQDKDKKTETSIPLNQILYGPPGTGKTYNVVVKAMAIIKPDCIEYDENGNVINYPSVKEEFDKAKDNHQIEFVTFHQSYSYEEFVEGIKPDLENETLNYKLEDGVFKRICNRAENDLYAITKDAEIDFDKAYKLFQEKYGAGSNLLNLKNIRYEENNLVYHFGSQTGDRRIDLSKIKDIFNSNKKYETATEFNRDYKGNNTLRGYFFNFYKELIKIKNDCDKENQDKNNIKQNPPKYVLIIDEINRGNISKIFGELITLIETDKRLGENHELQVSLPYSQESFGVPKNLYIIGTMNTSDRSIASIDIALRRRFTFKEMMPEPKLISDDLNVFGLNVREIFTILNKRISVLLDRDHQIGHSYFMKLETGENLEKDFKQIWFECIMPLLNEYFYGDWEKLQAILGKPQKDGESFICKLPNAIFATDYSCDNDETFDFTPQNQINFEKALNNAFGA